MLSQTTEHAIRALLYLAGHADGETVSAERIAQALGAPANYLAKTLNTLAKHRLVTGTRGPSGGFRLAMPAEAVTLAAVAEVFEAEPRIAACLLGDRPCDALHPCAAHYRWLAVRESTRAPLRRTTLADLLDPTDFETSRGFDAADLVMATTA